VKEILVTNSTPNNKGFILPTNNINWDRFNKHPVMLKGHQWESDPLGLWTIRIQGDDVLATPSFNEITPESKTAKQLYELGQLTASIGGFVKFKTVTNALGKTDLFLDASGYMVADEFEAYEISLVTLPSNPDAVQLSAHIYEDTTKEQITQFITLNSNKMAEPVTPTPAHVVDDNSKISVKEAGSLFKTVLDALGMGKIKEADKPVSVVVTKQDNEPSGKTGLAAKIDKAKKKMEGAKGKAEDAKKKLEEVQKKVAEAGDNVSPEYKQELEDAETAYNECSKAYDDHAKVYNALMEDDEEETMSAKVQLASALFPLSNLPKVNIKPTLVEPSKLNTTPVNVKVNETRFKTMTQLAASNDAQDKQIIEKFKEGLGAGKEDREYKVIMTALASDPKFCAVANAFRMHTLNSGVDMQAVTSKHYKNQPVPEQRGGQNIMQLLAAVDNGSFRVGLDSSPTNTFLANPSTYAIDFLSLAFFTLYPKGDWKTDIPTFNPTMTTGNLGLVWANIAASPLIYIGTQPTNPANYSVDDDAVSMSMLPYFLQPILWNNYKTAVQRYDVQGMQWAQSLDKFWARIDSNLITTFLEQANATSLIYSTGQTNTTTGTLTTNISPNSNNSWIDNPAYNGTVNNLVLNDIFSIEQLFRKQNYRLNKEKVQIVVDPTGLKMLKTDPNVQTLLNKFSTNAGEKDFSELDLNTTVVKERSEVGLLSSTGTVIDPTGSVPATATGANLAFIASQLGIGFGMFDVFVQQDPTNYGLKLSCDARMGASLMRKTGNGAAILGYSAAI
jgi:predicted transcriptional regulator